MITMHLPNNAETFLSEDSIVYPKLNLGYTLYVCTNALMRLGNCDHCGCCKYAVIVEKTEDNKDFWIQYIEMKRYNEQ